jgi:SulP family sulfate permease
MLAGLTVALALVPEAVAFAFVAGVQSAGRPLCRFHRRPDHRAASAAGPGMISGATGALAVVMVSLVANHGVEYLFATVVLMGVFRSRGRIQAGQVHPPGAAPR